jgi:hypothetical protein
MRPFRGNVFNEAKTDMAVTAMARGGRLSILLGRVA